ncbi:MAG: efflux transporter outer membrane subunit [Deltaproteobacteria bacterium]|jgi:Cu(I)/Ag(I) efflux system outer membrane protein|nr:efflux transporter outer membrane subunit [Deltaproteobacteria bacterium]
MPQIPFAPDPCRRGQRIRRILPILLLVIFLPGCSLAPDYVRPSSPVPGSLESGAPPGDPSGSVEPGRLPGPYVGTGAFYPEPRLRALIGLALANNRDLRTQGLNVEEALARHGIAQADRLPGLEAGLGDSVKGGQNLRTSNSYSAELMLPSFELDFFGKLKNASLSAREAYLASMEARDAFRISLVQAVALAYLEERLSFQKEKLAERTIKSWKDALAFMENRVVSGQASLLELEQARGQVGFAEAQLLAMRVERQRYQNALELLVGDYGKTPLPGASDLLSWEPSVASLGLSGPMGSNVLLARPDVLAAERELIAAHYDIGVARANFFPSISLTGSLGLMSGELSNLFVAKDSAWALTPGLSLPIFSGGRNMRQLELATTAKDKLALAYEKTIQQAFKETADALLPRADLLALLEARARYLATQRRVLELAGSRYQNGAIGYLEVLDAQRSVFEAESDLLDAKASWIANSVNLFAALGGGLNDSGLALAPQKPREPAGDAH